jgi:hypothetical protein
MIVFDSPFRLSNGSANLALTFDKFIEGEVMKTRKTSTKLIIITMVVAALAVAGFLREAGWLQPVEAQTGDGSVRFVSYASFGIVPGEKVRLSVANTAESAGTLSLSFQYYLAHGSNSSNSVPLYESEWIQVARGEFSVSDVSRRDLNTEGEPRTGRAEVLVRVTIKAPVGSNSKDSPVSLEVVKEDTGATSGDIGVHEVGHLMDTAPPAAASIGFIHGERLSFNVFNPSEEGGVPVRAQAYIYDATGRLITRSAEVDLRPGESDTFAFNRDDLPLAGEPDTARLQVRAVIKIVLLARSVRPLELPVWRAVVNNLTGATSGGAWFKTMRAVDDDDGNIY